MMSEIERFDAVFLGGGAAAKNFAPHLAKSGQRTAVVERRWIGGACPNVNCLPTKNEVWSAKVIDLVRRGAQFGAVAGPLVTDTPRVRQRKRAMVDGFVELYSGNDRAAGVELIMGEGCFVGPKTIEVRLKDGGVRVMRGERVFINTGTHAAMPDVPGLAAAQPMTNIEALELETSCRSTSSCWAVAMSAWSWHRPFSVSAARSPWVSTAGRSPHARTETWQPSSTGY